MRKPTLCLDFDGVLHSYISGWKGHDVIPDPPVPGAMQFLLQAVDKFDVCIFSSRSALDEGRDAMVRWIDYWVDKELTEEEAYRVKCGIDFPVDKPAAFVSIDDRAITFTGTWPDLDELLQFKPWNKK